MSNDIHETIYITDKVKQKNCNVMQATNGIKVYCVDQVLDFGGPAKGAIKFGIPESCTLSKIDIEVVPDKYFNENDAEYHENRSAKKMRPDNVLSCNMKSDSKKLTSSAKRRK